MRRLSRIFWSGLATVLPIAITVAIVYWLGLSLEAVLGGLLRLFIPDRYYVPGTGIAAALLLVLAVGVVMHAWAVRKLVDIGGALIARIPLAKTIYGGVRDIMHYISVMAEEGGLGKVVMVEIDEGAALIGFLTSERLSFASVEGGEPLVAVYLPMSYQLGGYTVCLPASRVRRVGLTNEEAMRWVLTAGVSRTSEDPS